jgi:hypothetical protein
MRRNEKRLAGLMLVELARLSEGLMERRLLARRKDEMGLCREPVCCGLCPMPFVPDALRGTSMLSGSAVYSGVAESAC